MLTALAVLIEVIRVIELRLTHRALKHSEIRFRLRTLLALSAVHVLFELF